MSDNQIENLIAKVARARLAVGRARQAHEHIFRVRADAEDALDGSQQELERALTLRQEQIEPALADATWPVPC